LTAVAYLLIPIYWEYSSPTFSDQGLGWNFFYWSRTSGWNFISFSWYDVQSFILTVGLALLSIVVLVFAALGYRYKSPPLAFGVMITTFLLLNLSLYGYYLTFTGGGLAIPIDIPILIALLVFSYQSRLEIQQRGPQSQ